MTTARRQRSSRPVQSRHRGGLRARLAEAEGLLRAIRSGEVDAVVVAAKQGPQVFTLQGAEHAYRVLIESMNEGALSLSADALILYANRCFARMVRLPLEQVIGCPFRRFLSVPGKTLEQLLLKGAVKSGARIQTLLRAGDGVELPVHLSIRPLAPGGKPGTNLGMVVTDMTEARRGEDRLRALSRRLVDAQETERRLVAFELHENISQLTYAILMRCEILARALPARARAPRAELLKLRDLLSQATEEVRRIALDLRPGALDDLGLLPVLCATCKQFGERARVRINLAGVRRIARLPAAVETTLYRILQEVLRNVEQHARAHRVTVSLQQQGGSAQLTITDDGIGFAPVRRPGKQRVRDHLGLLSVRERAASMGGTLEITSAPGQGTSIRARIPLDNGTRIPTA